MIPDTNYTRGTKAPLERRDRPVMIPNTRKSCDNCHNQKRKCDGDGKGKCGRCAKHRQDCIYSSRARRAIKARPRPKAPPPAKKPPRPNKAPGVGAIAGTPIPGGCSIKRPSLGASAATGLVGMQENALLKNFFCCLGFLPLTSRSVIREAVIRILCPITTRQERNRDAGRLKPSGSCPRDRGEMPRYFGDEIDVPVDTVAVEGSRDGLGTDISVCTFWCAVAMGGLVEGRPAKLVEKYFQMAEEGLERCMESNSPTPALAQPDEAEPVCTIVCTIDIRPRASRAWAMLADTYSFTGDTIRFQRYMQRARSLLQAVLRRSSEVELPTGLLELLSCELNHNGSGPGTTRGGKRRSQTISIHSTASEGDIFAFHVKSMNLLQRAMHRRSRWRSECLGEADTCCLLSPDEIVDDLRECVAPFEALEDAVDKPHIREGIGALMINSMIMMAKALKGDVSAARKRLACIIDVLECYPGISTNMMGKHICHSAAAWLAATDDPVSRGLYGRLREAYNSAFCAGIRHPLPSYECWLGVDAFCDDVVCREVATMVEEWPISLSSPSPSLPHTDATHCVHNGAQAPPTACVLGESDSLRPSSSSLSLSKASKTSKAHGVHGRTAIPRQGSTRQEDKAEDPLLLDGRPRMELEETTETLPPPFPLPEQDREATWYHEVLFGFPYEPSESALPETSNPAAFAVTVQSFRDLEDARPRCNSNGGGVAEAEHPIDYSGSELDGSDLEMASAAVASTVDNDLEAPNLFERTYRMLSK